MAVDTTVNPQITDAVTQSNGRALGELPADILADVFDVSDTMPSEEEKSREKSEEPSASE